MDLEGPSVVLGFEPRSAAHKVNTLPAVLWV